MAAFEVSITPLRKREVKKPITEENIVPKLTFAPFKTIPEVLFGVIPINSQIAKPLIVYNPNSVSLTVQLKNINPEDRISLDDPTFQLKSGEEKEVNILWSPIQPGYLRKVISFQDAYKKARSFDVVLSGTCVNDKVNTKKRKKFRDETNKTKFVSGTEKNFNSTMTLNSKNDKPSDDAILRRQTYRIEGKENCRPFEMKDPFRTSSPNHTTFDSALKNSMTNYSDENLRIFDNIDAPSKYSNFESELRLKTNLSDFHSSNDETPSRRGTYVVHKENISPRNDQSLSFIDELDSAKAEGGFFDSLIYNLTPNPQNLSFEKDLSDNGICITPMKSLNSLKSVPEFADLLMTPKESTNLNLTHELSSDNFSYSSKKSDLLFISPPNKGFKSKKSPEYLRPRRIVSSAISDRKRHLKTNILPKRKTPPTNKKHQMTSMDKIKTQDPNSLKQVLKSHISDRDPFLKQSLYSDEHWIDRQEKDIIKWMNSLLTPPTELDEESESSIDAAEMWLKSCRDSALKVVPSMDNVAKAVYHRPQRFDTLRKVALSLAASEPVRTVFENINIVIEKKIISVREDRDLHLDQGLKNKLMQLLSCYNPLWLQIALEAVYNQKIARQGKADVGGLGWFIRKNLLTTSTANKKNAHPAVLQIKKPSYKDQVKKYILGKFLRIIYFLDQAKMKKLIRYNPCLFLPTSDFKSSQDLLLAFCEDLIVGRGDIVKHLKAINYILQYKQTCIDEYDYTISSLHDLKDGVRLSRLFEILFSEPDICSKLRVPAISLLQKIFNVSVAMKVAEEKCKIEGEIIAKDIVAGNREKMLSFLWQIINNYLSPLYTKSALKIQKWWRVKLITLRLKNFRLKKQQQSATIIQTAWKNYLMRKKMKVTFSEISRRKWAATIIQRRFKTLMAIKESRKMIEIRERACINIQSWWRSVSIRRKFLDIKSKIIVIQRWYRANKSMKNDYTSFINIKKQIVIVQRIFRAKMMMRSERERFLKLKEAAIVIQRRYLAQKLMKNHRTSFLKIKKQTILIQRIFRAKLMMLSEREKFLKLKYAAITIQRRFRANRQMKKDRMAYEKLKMMIKIVVVVQRRFRANKIMQIERQRFSALKSTAILIQRKFKAKQLMRLRREEFLKMKTAAIVIQQKFRATSLMKSERLKYLELRNNVIAMQRKFRAKKLMGKERDRYMLLRKAVISIQRLHRANLSRKREIEKKKAEYAEYLKQKTAVILIQTKFRAYQQMKLEKNRFLRVKKAVIFLQQKFRANQIMQVEHQKFVALKSVTISMQRRFRATKLMKTERQNYLNQRRAAIIIQQKYRAILIAKKDRQYFSKLKLATTFVQTQFRRNRTAKIARSDFLSRKRSCILIQRRFRALKICKQQRAAFLKLKLTVIYVQRVFRQKLLLREELEYEKKNSPEELAAIKIQSLWRGYQVRKRKIKPSPYTKKSNDSPKTKKLNAIINFQGTLGERYKKAISQLKTSDMYDVITKALWNLESVTILSSKLCEGVVAEGIIPIIFNLISRGNRSEPFLEIYRSSFSILVNLARYKPTKIALWKSMNKFDDIYYILHIMKITHDKFHVPVFCYVATLLWLLCLDPDIAMVIAELYSVRQQIEKILETLERKCLKNSQIKRSLKQLPKTEADWYPKPSDRIFQNHYVAIFNVHKVLFKR